VAMEGNPREFGWSGFGTLKAYFGASSLTNRRAAEFMQ